MKYAIILNNEVVYKYEADERQVFGGEWGSEEALHLEIPNEYDLNLLTWDGESFGQRDLTELELKAIRLQEAQVKALKNQKDLEFGQFIIALVGSMNEEKDLTHEQKNSMMLDQAINTIMIMLQAGRVGYATQLINAYDVNESYFTQEDKDQILQLLTDYLGNE
jgi:hypothetical protein